MAAGVVLPLQWKNVRFRFVFHVATRPSGQSLQDYGRETLSAQLFCPGRKALFLIWGTVEAFISFNFRPSSLDAVFFAHLAQIMEFPSELQNHLLTFPTLVSFYESIMKHYFSASRGEATSDNMFVVRV